MRIFKRLAAASVTLFFVAAVPNGPAMGMTDDSSTLRVASTCLKKGETKRQVINAVAFEEVYGPLYGKCKKAHPQTSPSRKSIIWSNDGCSVPAKVKKVEVRVRTVTIPLGKLISNLDKFWQKSCDRHDFGYRNYGKASAGMQLDSNGSKRMAIDIRFRDNMVIQCKRVYGGDRSKIIPLTGCLQGATVFYNVVRKAGGLKY